MAPGYQKSKAALARAARLKVTIVSSSDPDSSKSDNCHWGVQLDYIKISLSRHSEAGRSLELGSVILHLFTALTELF
jgi:hypothetical protein